MVLRSRDASRGVSAQHAVWGGAAVVLWVVIRRIWVVHAVEAAFNSVVVPALNFVWSRDASRGFSVQHAVRRCVAVLWVFIRRICFWVEHAVEAAWNSVVPALNFAFDPL